MMITNRFDTTKKQTTKKNTHKKTQQNKTKQLHCVRYICYHRHDTNYKTRFYKVGALFRIFPKIFTL